MSVTLVTGVPGTGKTAQVVSMILEAVVSGRPVFVDGVKGLHNSTPFYRCGKITEWCHGTWLHIDQYVMTDGTEEVQEDDDGSANWQQNSDVFLLSDDGEILPQPKSFPVTGGQLQLVAVRNPDGTAAKIVDYETHKGAIVFIDEAQRYFRPRPQGAKVPDYVAAFEVHRHQGLDFVLITQRPALIDFNIRGLVSRHIALRAGWFGRYLYEWSEVGDIESKTSRETAARQRFKLPKDVFDKYDSAVVHTTVKRKLPMAAKLLMVILPLALVFFGLVYKTIKGKIDPQAQVAQQATQGKVTHPPAAAVAVAPAPAAVLAVVATETLHPFANTRIFIVGFLSSATKKLYRFNAVGVDGTSYSLSQADVVSSGYTINPLSDCSAELFYKETHLYVTCMPRGGA